MSRPDGLGVGVRVSMRGITNTCPRRHGIVAELDDFGAWIEVEKDREGYGGRRRHYTYDEIRVPSIVDLLAGLARVR